LVNKTPDLHSGPSSTTAEYAPPFRCRANVTATCTPVSHWPPIRCNTAPRRKRCPLFDVCVAYFRRDSKLRNLGVLGSFASAAGDLIVNEQTPSAQTPQRRPRSRM
jgi:hypothetical protein